MPKGVDRLKEGQREYRKHTFKPWEMGKNHQQAERVPEHVWLSCKHK